MLDVRTAALRACVSVPGFDPADPAASLEAPNSPFLNRALQAYAVGSVFKPVLAAAALGYALLGPGAPVSAAGAAGQVQEGPVEGYEAADHQNDEDTLSFRLDASPEFEKGGKNGGLYLENPRENRYDLQADIELEDGTVVYSSPVLEPDSHIDTVDLDEELEDGTYPAQARLFAVDPESGVIVGYVLQPIELRVGNAD